MNPQEKQLIEEVFNRLASVAGGAKDQAADQLIGDALRKLPDAPYYLVQTVIVQGQGLERADQRVRELEEQLSAIQRGDRGGSDSFLSGVRAPQPSAARPQEGPWSRAGRPADEAGRSSGFLSSALSTASGVAGGVFIADAIRSLFGGTRGSIAKASDQAAIDRAQDKTQDAEDEAAEAKRQLASDDAAADEAQDADDDYDDGWSDDDGIDI